MANVIIQPQDKRLFVANPNKDFNPARNKAIIEETIKETTKFFQGLQEVLDDGLMDRIDIVGTYGRYRFNQGHKTIEQYLGRAQYAKLIGERTLEKVKMMQSVNKLNGNDKFKNFILN